MGLLNKLGAAVGIGGAAVEVRVAGSDEDDPWGAELTWGDTVRGTLHVHGGKTDQAIKEVKVFVRERYETRDSDGDTETVERQHSTAVVARGLPVAAGQSLEPIPFEVTVPRGLALGHHYSVGAQLAIPGAADGRGDAPFQMVLPAPQRGLLAALGKVAEFQPTPVISTDSKGRLGVTVLPESAALKKKLDGVTFSFADPLLVADDLPVDLEINPQENSLADHFKALLRKDLIRSKITLSRADLLAAAEGRDVPESLLSTLRSLLDGHLA